MSISIDTRNPQFTDDANNRTVVNSVSASSNMNKIFSIKSQSKQNVTYEGLNLTKQNELNNLSTKNLTEIPKYGIETLRLNELENVNLKSNQ